MLRSCGNNGFTPASFCFLYLLIIATSVHAGPETDLNAGKAAAIGSEANFSKLRSFKCRFTITKADALSPSEALKGNYSNARQCEFLLVVDGKNSKLQALTAIDTTPPKNLKEGINPSSGQKQKYFSTDFLPVAELNFGETKLSHMASWRQAQIIDGDGGVSEETPLSALYWKPTNGLRSWRSAADQGQAKINSRGVVTEGGATGIHLEYQTESSRMSILFDPNRGYLPVRCELFSVTSNGERRPGLLVQMLDAKDVGARRWFPVHIVSFSEPRRHGQTLSLMDYRVNELVMDKVSDEDLRLELPAGTTVLRRDMPVGGREYITFRQNEKLAPSDIPRLERMLTDSAKLPMMDTAVNPRNRQSYWKWAALALGAVLLAVTLFLYLRHRRAVVSA